MTSPDELESQISEPEIELEPIHDEVFEVSQADNQKRRKELAQKSLEARLLQKKQQN
jgi:hypothetical protein